MIPIIVFMILTDFTSSLIQPSPTSSHALSSFNFFAISLQSFYLPKHPIWAIFYSVIASSAFSLIAFETTFFDVFFMLLYILFSSVLFRHNTLCKSPFLHTAHFLSSFNHHLLHPPLFFPHTSSHASMIPSLNFALQHQLISLFLLQIDSKSTYLSAKISFFYQHMSISLLSLVSSYLYLLLLRRVETPQGLPSHFEYTFSVVSLSTQRRFFSYFHPF